jgi:FkbM family methyltransferase
MNLFRYLRPRDINVEVAISDVEGEAAYYQFKFGAFNGLEAAIAEQRAELASNHSEWASPGQQLKSKIIVHTEPLRNVLEKHLAPRQQIDFMSIDVEGLELQVLQSNDWERFQPRVVVVEILQKTIDHITVTPVAKYLASLGYVCLSKCVNTVFFASPMFAKSILEISSGATAFKS